MAKRNHGLKISFLERTTNDILKKRFEEGFSDFGEEDFSDMWEPKKKEIKVATSLEDYVYFGPFARGSLKFDTNFSLNLGSLLATVEEGRNWLQGFDEYYDNFIVEKVGKTCGRDKKGNIIFRNFKVPVSLGKVNLNFDFIFSRLNSRRSPFLVYSSRFEDSRTIETTTGVIKKNPRDAIYVCFYGVNQFFNGEPVPNIESHKLVRCSDGRIERYSLTRYNRQDENVLADGFLLGNLGFDELLDVEGVVDNFPRNHYVELVYQVTGESTEFYNDFVIRFEKYDVSKDSEG